jgi:hypothetical protein
MRNPSRKIALVLASTDHGTIIVDRFDYRTVENRTFGVGIQLLESSAFDPRKLI